MKRFFTYVGYALLGLLGLLLIVLALTQTGWFRGWLRGVIEERANSALAVEVRIGSLEGNLFTRIQLGDILLRTDEDTLLLLPGLTAEYDLLPLLQKTVVVRSLHLKRPDIQLHQRSDSSWNVQSLVPRDTAEKAEVTTTDNASAWRIHFHDAWIEQGALRFCPLDSNASFPRSVNGLTLHCSGTYGAEAGTVSVDSLAFQAIDPSLVVEELKGRLNYAGDTLYLPHLQIRSRHNALRASGWYVYRNGETAKVTLSTSPVQLSEFAHFLPGVESPAAPEITAEVQYADDAVAVRCTVRDEQQVFNLRGLFDIAGDENGLFATASFQNIDLAHWLNDETPSTDMSGTCSIQSNGLDLNTASGNASIALTDSRIQGRKIETATLGVSYSYGTLNGTAAFTGPFGGVSLSADLHDVLDEQQFSVELRTKQLDLAPLLEHEDVSSRISGALQVEGSGLDPASMSARFFLRADSSSFSDVALSSLRGAGTVDGMSVTVDTLNIHTTMLDLHVAGLLGIQDRSSLRFVARIKDLAPLDSILAVESLAASGILEGTVTGTADSAVLGVSFDMTGLRAIEGRLDSLSGEIELSLHGDEFSLSGKALAMKPGYSSVQFDSIAAIIGYEDDSLFSQLDYLESHGIGGRIQALAHIDSAITITVPLFHALRSDTSLASLTDTAFARITEREIEIESFDLRADSYRLHADGKISFEDESRFDLQIRHGDLERMLGLLGSSTRASGTLDADFSLRGSLSDPRLSSALSVADAISGEYHLGDLHADLLYADSSLSWNTSLHQPDGKRITSSGFLPLIPSEDNDAFRIPGDRPLSFLLGIDRFDVSTLNPIVDAADRLDGVLRADISIENTLDHPRFDGYVLLDSAAFLSTSPGLSYDQVRVRILGRNEKLLLDDFRIRSGGGVLTASGYLGRPTDFLDRSLRQAKLNVQARRFVLVEDRNLEMTIDGDVGFTAADDSASLTGNMTIVRSNFWLPAFFEQMRHRPSAGEIPLLVQATQEDRETRPLVLEVPAKPPPKLLKNLHGTIRIDIPRNTWFRSPDINMEINGTLDILISGDSLQLFGFVRVYRGTFMVYGKRFEVVEGRLDFHGGTSRIPSISTEVVYRFRGINGQQEELLLNLQGNALSPEYRFLLNNERVDERNAMSYILFGRSLDELSQDQRSSISQSTGAFAAGIAASFVAAQLSNTVGQSLGLDVVELTAKDSWQNTSFTVGKYLSDELYVRYTRKLESTNSNETAMDEVALAYRFLPFLYVQVTQGTTKSTGYDLIFRFD